MDDVLCDEEDQKITDCRARVVINDCGHKEDVWLNCKEEGENFRLEFLILWAMSIVYLSRVGLSCKSRDYTAKFARSFYNVIDFSPYASQPLSPLSLLAVSYLSVTVCWLELSGTICRNRERIFHQAHVPYFGVFNDQIVLQYLRSCNLWW